MRRCTTPTAFALAAALAAGCGADRPARSGTDVLAALDRVAESYVQLVLAMGQHDPNYVDAYYGPEAWREEAEATERPLSAIRSTADSLTAELGRLETGREDELARLRHTYLTRQLAALSAYAGLLQGERLDFDAESGALYDAVAPSHSESHYAAILERLDALLPGEGPLIERLERFRADFVIPRERLDTVFQAAIAEARRRTAEHIALPAGESFTIEYVTDKPWSGYNWYQGGARSLIQLNVEFPITIDRALDLAAHEGYPGHHVYNTLLEARLVEDRGWVEFSVYPLFSPQSLIAEGSANFGVEVAFPGDERIAFERDVLFPLAGLDPDRVEEYYRVHALAAELSYAGNEAARGYLNGEWSAARAIDWLTTYALMSPERARQRIRFFDTYRSYVINYNLGQDLVREYIERRGGTADRPDRRWQEFEALLASPRLPSGLR